MARYRTNFFCVYLCSQHAHRNKLVLVIICDDPWLLKFFGDSVGVLGLSSWLKCSRGQMNFRGARPIVSRFSKLGKFFHKKSPRSSHVFESLVTSIYCYTGPVSITVDLVVAPDLRLWIRRLLLFNYQYPRLLFDHRPLCFILKLRFLQVCLLMRKRPVCSRIYISSINLSTPVNCVPPTRDLKSRRSSLGFLSISNLKNEQTFIFVCLQVFSLELLFFLSSIISCTFAFSARNAMGVD